MKVIDLTYLHSVSDGDKELEQSLVSIFLEQLDEFDAQMQLALKNTDLPKLAAVAHKAKSSILSMGMTELATAMKRLEMVSKTLFVEQCAAKGISDERLYDYQKQIFALPDEIKCWVEKNKSQKVILDLINFYKLHAEMAREDLSTFSQTNN